MTTVFVTTTPLKMCKRCIPPEDPAHPARPTLPCHPSQAAASSGISWHPNARGRLRVRVPQRRAPRHTHAAARVDAVSPPVPPFWRHCRACCPGEGGQAGHANLHRLARTLPAIGGARLRRGAESVPLGPAAKLPGPGPDPAVKLQRQMGPARCRLRPNAPKPSPPFRRRGPGLSASAERPARLPPQRPGGRAPQAGEGLRAARRGRVPWRPVAACRASASPSARPALLPGSRLLRAAASPAAGPSQRRRAASARSSGSGRGPVKDAVETCGGERAAAAPLF